MAALSLAVGTAVPVGGSAVPLGVEPLVGSVASVAPGLTTVCGGGLADGIG